MHLVSSSELRAVCLPALSESQQKMVKFRVSLQKDGEKWPLVSLTCGESMILRVKRASEKTHNQPSQPAAGTLSHRLLQTDCSHRWADCTSVSSRVDPEPDRHSPLLCVSWKVCFFKTLSVATTRFC